MLVPHLTSPSPNRRRCPTPTPAWAQSTELRHLPITYHHGVLGVQQDLADLEPLDEDAGAGSSDLLGGGDGSGGSPLLGAGVALGPGVARGSEADAEQQEEEGGGRELSPLGLGPLGRGPPAAAAAAQEQWGQADLLSFGEEVLPRQPAPAQRSAQAPQQQQQPQGGGDAAAGAAARRQLQDLLL